MSTPPADSGPDGAAQHERWPPESAMLDLAEGLRRSGLTHVQLWIRYFGLGGSGTADELRHHLDTNDCHDSHEHNIIAQALNDAFIERGDDHPVAYRHLYRHRGDR